VYADGMKTMCARLLLACFCGLDQTYPILVAVLIAKIICELQVLGLIKKGKTGKF
jgi:hypothetical protein